MCRSVIGRLPPSSSPESPMSSESSLKTPRRPSASSPQHLTVLSSMMAQVWKKPATTDREVVVGRSAFCSPEPISAEVSASLLDPMPSWPLSLSPQQATLRSSSNAHVWLYPALIATAVRPLPRSTVARSSPISPDASPALPEVVFSPVLPSPLLPQQRTLPLSRIAQVCA